MLRSAIAERGDGDSVRSNVGGDCVRGDSVPGIMSWIRLGMGWVGSWVIKMDPWTTLRYGL